MTPAHQWRDRLRPALLAARKARDTARISALRSAMSAIDNAETLEAETPQAETPHHIDLRAANGPIAGAVTGLGATEVDRRELSEQDIRDLLRSEIAERECAAAEITAAGYADRTGPLRDEVAVLIELLRDS